MHWIDPDFLPVISGTVERFIVNPHGEVDGIVLAYESDKVLLVHVPPHLEQETETAVMPGDAIRVRGVRPRGADMIAAVSLTTKDGQAIVDNGPAANRKQRPHPRGKPGKMSISGTVRLSLFGPKGELRGALLDDGAVVRIGPKEAAHFVERLRPRASVAVRGDGLETKHGRVITAKEIGLDLDHLQPIKATKPDDGGRRRHHPPGQHELDA
jgi:hypothetical protein